MAEWNRFKEEKKYTKVADTNVNPKHVGEPLRKLTLEDRMEIRRIARENSNKLSKAFEEEQEGVEIEDDPAEDPPNEPNEANDPDDAGAPSEPSNPGKRSASGEVEAPGKKAKIAEGDEELELEVVSATQVVVAAEAKDAGDLVEDLASAVVSLADDRPANGTKDTRKLAKDLAEAVVSIADNKPGKPSRTKSSKGGNAVVELDTPPPSSAAAKTGAERRARRKARTTAGLLTVPSPACSPSPVSEAYGDVEVLE